MYRDMYAYILIHTGSYVVLQYIVACNAIYSNTSYVAHNILCSNTT